MSIELIKRAHEARTKAEMDIRTILDTAGDRELTGEEQASIDVLDAASREHSTALQDLIDSEQRNRDIDAAINSLGAPDRAPAAKDYGKELRALGRGEAKVVDVAHDPAVLGVNGIRNDLTKGTTTAGGHTVPTSFYGQLMAHLIEVSGVMAAGPTIFATQSGESIEVPVTTAHSTSALTAEATQISESDPAFAKRTLGAYKYGHVIQVSRELLEDTGVDLLGYLAMQSGRALGNNFGTDLVVGNASSKPSGIVQTATTGVTGATSVAGVFTADNLIDLYYSVIAPYRASPSCGWMMRDATIAKVRKLKDDNNQYLWQPALTAGAPDILLGKPVHSDPNVAATATSAKSVIFGDFSAYIVRLAGGVRFERSDDFAFDSDLVTFKAVVRGDGILADQTGAVKVFAGGAS